MGRLETLIALAIALLSGSALTALIQALASRQKVGMESSKINVEAGVVVFETLKDMINPLREELKRVEAMHERCQHSLMLLTARFDDLKNKLDP